MKAEELVKAVLTAENTELFDKSRIEKLIKNLLKRRGVLVMYKDKITISHPAGKSKKITYHIDMDLLTEKQLDTVTVLSARQKN